MTSNRRSVYLPVIRSGLYDVFQAFDFADPSTSNGKRIPTTVAPQALFMMNDRLVLRCSDAMAGRLLARTDLDTPGRIDLAFRRAYGRPAIEERNRSRRGLLAAVRSGIGRGRGRARGPAPSGLATALSGDLLVQRVPLPRMTRVQGCP